LNTASKQIVVQVLLKSLHEFGDYNPPVMIDTVMGVLDESSRATVLENYFPELSHQTLLLSSDSEIRPGKDFDKIEPFISKVYTLQRDREKQLTEVVPGYFGKTLNN
jgi:DNA sulfur modification protein DndD